METLKEFKKYFSYIIYSSKAKLKNEVAGSYLNYLWWIITPLCMMLIYFFVACVVFKSREPNFQIFIIIGLTLWDYFNKVVVTSTRLVKTNTEIISKIYIPKYVLLMTNSFVYIYKFLISFGIVLVFMIIFKVSFTLKMLYFVPITLLLFFLTFGIGLIVMHFGVYIVDLNNLVNIVLKIVFYFSGIFYNVGTMVPSPYNNILLTLNPIALLINESRNVLLYNTNPDWMLLFIWFIVAIIINIIGIKLIKKYENSYSKVGQ